MAKPKDDLTFEFVYKILTYDCFTGEHRWSDNLSDLEHMGSHAMRYRGEVAGVNAGRYIRIRIKNRLYLAHRLAWLMVYEKWPDGIIDHRDGDGLNNRIENLRETDFVGNSRNMRRERPPASGVFGVVKIKDKFRATISVPGKHIYLGLFDTIEEAAAARKEASQKHGFNELHGTAK